MLVYTFTMPPKSGEQDGSIDVLVLSEQNLPPYIRSLISGAPISEELEFSTDLAKLVVGIEDKVNERMYTLSTMVTELTKTYNGLVTKANMQIALAHLIQISFLNPNYFDKGILMKNPAPAKDPGRVVSRPFLEPAGATFRPVPDKKTAQGRVIPYEIVIKDISDLVGENVYVSSMAREALAKKYGLTENEFESTYQSALKLMASRGLIDDRLYREFRMISLISQTPPSTDFSQRVNYALGKSQKGQHAPVVSVARYKA